MPSWPCSPLARSLAPWRQRRIASFCSRFNSRLGRRFFLWRGSAGLWRHAGSCIGPRRCRRLLVADLGQAPGGVMAELGADQVCNPPPASQRVWGVCSPWPAKLAMSCVRWLAAYQPPSIFILHTEQTSNKPETNPRISWPNTSSFHISINPEQSQYIPACHDFKIFTSRKDGKNILSIIIF